MIARDLERILGERNVATAAELDLMARELRKFNILPTGGRGPYAPKIDAARVANFVIAAAGSSKASHAARTVLDYTDLTPTDGERSEFIGAEKLGEAVTFMFSEQAHAEIVDCLRICRTGPAAEIVFRAAGTRHVARFGETFRQATMTVWAEVPAGMIRDIALELHDTGPGASWSPPEE